MRYHPCTETTRRTGSGPGFGVGMLAGRQGDQHVAIQGAVAALPRARRAVAGEPGGTRRALGERGRRAGARRAAAPLPAHRSHARRRARAERRRSRHPRRIARPPRRRARGRTHRPRHLRRITSTAPQRPAELPDGVDRPRARDGRGAAVAHPARRAPADAHRAGRRRQDPPRHAGRRRGRPPSFPTASRFVPLAPLGDPALVLGAIAQALGVPDVGEASLLEMLAATLANKRALLVLDNFEHLAEAAPDVATLLLACPALKVLATSRAALRVRGEQEYRVPPLALPGHADLASVEITGTYPRRAPLRRPRPRRAADFALGSDNAAAVGDDLRPAGRPAAGDRARRRARAAPAAAGAPGAPRPRVAAADGRGARPARAPADDARRHRLELRPAHPRRAGPLPPPRRLRRRLDPRRGRGGRAARGWTNGISSRCWGS